MPFSIGGVGTQFYGASSPHPDKSHISTKWVTVIFFPLFPISSGRIIREPKGDITFFIIRYTAYRLAERLPMQWRQVGRTYLFSVAYLMWIGGVSIALGLAADNQRISIVLETVLGLISYILPFLLLRAFRANAKRVKREYAAFGIEKEHRQG